MPRPTIFAILLLVATAASLSAQPATSSLTGRVTSGRKGVPAVTVTVASSSLLGVRVTTTGPDGSYFLRGLPPGAYDIEFSKERMQTVLRRSELQVSDTSRVDVVMARSEVAETVTSTTLMPPLLEVPQLSTPIEAATVDRLPIGPSVAERLLLAPGLPPLLTLRLIDGVAVEETVGEAIAESNAVTGSLSSEYGAAGGGLLTTVTRSGGNELHGSARVTVDQRKRSSIDAAAGGALVEERVWFFGGVRHSDDADAEESTLSLAKVTADVAENQTLRLARHDDLSARFDGVLGHRSNVELLASDDQWSVKGHHSVSIAGAGNHSLVAGAEEPAGNGARAFFINDVWRALSRWTVTAGLRDDGRLQPRVGAVYDFHADGEHRIGATWGRYQAVDETTVTYGWRFGSGGYARADYIRRAAIGTTDLLQLHGSYDLFRMFRVGGNYTARIRGGGELRRRGNGWFWYEGSMAEGVMTLSLLQRYLASATETFFSTDVSAMYAYPIQTFTTFARVDLINSFDRPNFSSDELALPRTWRASLGVRF